MNYSFLNRVIQVGLLFLLLNSLLCQNYVFAQKEGNVWYFGYYAGLDFNSGVPVALTDGALSNKEGCASICDNNGVILFYTNGILIWNKNHQVMPNGSGLLGGNSSTQSAIIAKKPNSSTLYYVFTVAEEVGSSGLRYSIIDMSLSSGLGDVTSSKNIAIVTPTCEKITAIKHKNNTDYWVVTRLFNSNAFHAYLLSSSGLATSPVVSSVGTVISGPTRNSIGYLKASQDGKRLVVANDYINYFELFDFDNATGVVSNTMTFQGFANSSGPYGMEFSPNNNILYVSPEITPSTVYQYNLLAGSVTAIENSKTAIGGGSGRGGALQLAPDQKIYHSRTADTYLSVINNPNTLGTSCDYVVNGVYLKGKNTSFGLPTFYNSITLDSDFTFSQICFGDSTSFKVTSTVFDSVKWNFGDIYNAENTSTDLLPKHLYSDTGRYEVALITFYEGLSDTAIDFVNIYPLPVVFLGKDTTLCQGETLVLNVTKANATYVWQDNSTDSTFTVTQQGSYWVEVTVDNCSAVDVIQVNYNPLPYVDLGNDTTFCQGDKWTLDATTLNATYLWQDYSSNPTFEVSKQGNYWVQLIVNNCSATFDIHISYNPLPKIDLGTDSVLCKGEVLILNAGTLNASYIWQDNSTNSTFKVTKDGTYWVEVTVNNCSSTDVIDISYKPLPIVDLGTDTTLCQGEELLLDITTINAFYLWQNNSTNSTYLVSQAGTYWVEVTVDECTTRGTIQVDYNPLPVFDLGKDTSLCYGDILTINSSSPNASYLWQDQSTKSTFDICQPGTYWLVKTIDNCSSSDSILVSFIPVPPIDLGEDTFVCIGQTITLDVTSPNCRYIWQDYSSDPTYFVDQSATYWVEIIDSNCHNFDTIRVEFKNCDCYLFVPNAFTPDVNSLNETFKPSFDCILAEYNFKIFDRWGEKLFETSNPEEAWDGHFKGSVSPIGVYIYRIDYQFEDLEKQTKFGNVTLIR